MELGEAISGRRSIRRYKPDPVPEDSLKKVLGAGMDAPSAGNLQSRHFIIVKDPSLKAALAKAAAGSGFVGQAPVAMVVCADLRITARYGQRGADLYALLDCAASLQNMMLTAHSLGLGTCWVGAFDERKASEALDLPSHLRPVSMTPLGYPDESPKPHGKVGFEQACEFR